MRAAQRTKLTFPLFLLAHSPLLPSSPCPAFFNNRALTEILQSRDEKIRQDWIGVMETRIVREELAKCWRTEGASRR